MFVYIDPADNMNKRTFKAYITGSYEPKLPKRFIKNGQPPIYPDIDGLVETRATPAMIVDMCYHNKTINIPDINDIKTIIGIIEAYIASAGDLRLSGGEIKRYLDKCDVALKELKDVHDRFEGYRRNKYPHLYQKVSDAFATFYERLKETK